MNETNLDDGIQLNDLYLKVCAFSNNVVVVDARGIVLDYHFIILTLIILFFFNGLIIFWT